jgi:hypothetical protein
MNGWLLLLVVVVLTPYVVVPLLIRRNHYFLLKPQIRPVVAGFLPAAVLVHFDHQTTELKTLGFEHRIDVVSLDYGPHLKVFLRFYVAIEKSMMAVCTALMPEGASEPIKTFIEFSSRFIDGQEVATHNSDLMGAPIEHQKKHVAYFPSIANMKILLDCHEHAINQLGLSQQPKAIPDDGQELAFIVQNFQDDLKAQVHLGCLEFDTNQSSYRPTWAGAFLMGWYSMWPISSIRLLLYKLKARVTLRGLKRADA